MQLIYHYSRFVSMEAGNIAKNHIKTNYFSKKLAFSANKSDNRKNNFGKDDLFGSNSQF